MTFKKTARSIVPPLELVLPIFVLFRDRSSIAEKYIAICTIEDRFQCYCYFEHNIDHSLYTHTLLPAQYCSVYHHLLRTVPRLKRANTQLYRNIKCLNCEYNFYTMLRVYNNDSKSYKGRQHTHIASYYSIVC